MDPHEEFLELCAAATAGELTADEQAKLDSHLSSCPECRKAIAEYEVASRRMAASAPSELDGKEPARDVNWSVENAEKAFFQRLETEDRLRKSSPETQADTANIGRRFTYRPSQFRWREVWMSLAAVVVLALALAVTAYRSGVKRGTDIARVTNEPRNDSNSSREEQVNDASRERAQLLAKVGEQDRIIADLRKELSDQEKIVSASRATDRPVGNANSVQPSNPAPKGADTQRDGQLAAAQAKLSDLQKAIDDLTGQRDAVNSRAATLEAKVGELTQSLRVRDREVDQKEEEVAKLQELLQYDRDVRELMGSRDLYMADVHDVSKSGTAKTYGRVFYTKGKRLIFYAFDLDAQPGLQNASSFQAWGRKGPDKLQARSLGIFYEDNASKKRWVLKANDPKALEDIDAVFVTVEPNGGSQHPSGKPLLFAYLGVSPNHP